MRTEVGAHYTRQHAGMSSVSELEETMARHVRRRGGNALWELGGERARLWMQRRREEGGSERGEAAPGQAKAQGGPDEKTAHGIKQKPECLQRERPVERGPGGLLHLT